MGGVIGTGVRHWAMVHQPVRVSTSSSYWSTGWEIFLLHCRLGHVPSKSLNKLYPNVFKNVDRNKLVCDACELGKHTRSTYLVLVFVVVNLLC
jgi:hypothetical protein